MAAASTLLVRVDANQRIGTGHVMRCLALAQGWLDRGGSVRVLSSALPHGLRERLLAEGISVEEGMPALADIPATLNQVERHRSEWLVIDCDEVTTDLLSALHRSKQRTLVLDDWGRLGRYECDIVLNQNLRANSSLYEAKTNARLLLGPDYVLLRREIRATAGAREIRERVERLLMTLGGSDPDGVSLKLLRVVEKLTMDRALEVRLVVGAANARAQQIMDAAAGAKVEVLRDVKNMAEQYAWCDLALTASGSTVWELAYLGVPMLVGALVESEVPTGVSIADAGMGMYLGRFAEIEAQHIAAQIAALSANSALRRRISSRGGAMIDGKGVARIIDAMDSALWVGRKKRQSEAPNAQ